MKPPDLATLVHENICSQHDIENTLYYLCYTETCVIRDITNIVIKISAVGFTSERNYAGFRDVVSFI